MHKIKRENLRMYVYSFYVLANKKIVFDLNRTNLKGLLDGMTIDTNGNIWIALFDGSRVSIQSNI